MFNKSNNFDSTSGRTSLFESRFAFDAVLPLLSPDVMNVLKPWHEYFMLPFGIFLLLGCFLSGSLLFRFFDSSFFRNMCGGKNHDMNETDRYRFTLWVMQCVTSCVCVAMIVMVLDPCVIMYGTLFPGQVTGDVTRSWDEKLSWLTTIEQVWTVITWGVLPSMMVYLFEVLPLAGVPHSPRLPIHVHHLVVILTTLFGINAVRSTYDGKWLQMGFVAYFHIILEMPIWVALFAYRMQHIKIAKRLFLIALGYETLLRVVLWVWSTYIYCQLCWWRYTYTPWEVVWCYAFPVVCVVQIVTQSWTIGIHYVLYKKLVKMSANHSSEIGAVEVVTDDKLIKTKKTEHEEIISIPSSVSSHFNMTTTTTSAALHKKQEQKHGERKSHNKDLLFLTVVYGVFLWMFYACFVTSDYFSVDSGYVSQLHTPQKPQRIAIVGSGVAGLGAAWMLSQHPQHYEVTVFEANELIGGGSRTYEHANGVVIDEAFAQYSSSGYRNFEELLAYLNVSSVVNYKKLTGILLNKDMLFQNPPNQSNRTESKVEVDDDELIELFTLDPTDYASTSSYASVRDDMDRLSTLMEDSMHRDTEKELMTVTLEEYLHQRGGFSDRFIYRYLPLCLSQYVATGASLHEIPVGLFFVVESMFHSCLSQVPVKGLHVKGGAAAYMTRFVEKLRQQNVHFRVQSRIVAMQVHSHSWLDDDKDKEEVTAGNSIFPSSWWSNIHSMFRTYFLSRVTTTLFIQTPDSDTNPVQEEFDQVIYAIYSGQVHAILQHPETIVCPSEGSVSSSTGSIFPSTACANLHSTLFTSTQDAGNTLYSITHEDTEFMERVYAPLRDTQGCYHTEFYNLVGYIDPQNMTDIAGNFQSPYGIHTQLPVIKAQEPRGYHCMKHFTPPFVTHIHHPYDAMHPRMQPKQEFILSQTTWYHPYHSVSFFLKNRNRHLIQGMNNIWYVGGDVIANFHETALVSGLAIAHRLGTGYPFEQSSHLAKTDFARYRSWMFYGLNPFLPYSTERSSTTKKTSSPSSSTTSSLHSCSCSSSQSAPSQSSSTRSLPCRSVAATAVASSMISNTSL